MHDDDRYYYLLIHNAMLCEAVMLLLLKFTQKFFYFRFTLIGVNVGFCDEDMHMPEVYTSLLWEEVASWVREVSTPYREYSICNTEEEDNSKAVSNMGDIDN